MHITANYTPINEEETAKKLGMTVSDFRDMLEEGQFPPPIQLSAKTAVWLEEDVVSYLHLKARGVTVFRRDKKLKGKPVVKNLPVYEGDLCGRLSDLTDKIYEFPFVVGPVGSFVYFLLKETVLVYIGCSIRVGVRIQEHLTGANGTPKKDFDRALVMPVDREQMEIVERRMISTFNPPLNTTHRSN